MTSCCGAEHEVETFCGDPITLDLDAGAVVFVTIDSLGDCGNDTLHIAGP